MHFSLRALLRGSYLAALVLLTASLILPGLALAQDGQIDQQITKTMFVMHPQVMGHIDRLDQLRVPYLAETEIDMRDLLSHPVYVPPQSANPTVADGAMQTSSGPMVPGSAGLNFDGLGQGITGPNGAFTVNSVPPDPNLAVGTTQMIQTVNSGFAIYNKSTGGMSLGPYTIQTLWSTLPANSPCTGTVSGEGVSMSDPVVSFDQFAQRWIISVLALPYNSTTGAYLPPMYHCVAFSNSADAGAGWDVFQYNPGASMGITNDLPDYPKQGVWRDAYTFTYDMFNSTGSSYVGGAICGMDRNAILGGSLSPTIICFLKTSTDYALLPATVDGATYPSLQTSGTAGTDTCTSGSPCQPKSIFFELQDVSGSSTTLEYYRVHFNFTTTSHSAVDTRGTITVSSYNTTTCTNTSQCVPQPTHTGTLPSGETFSSESKLDTLADHAMWRAAYRNFGGYESVVFDSTVRGTTTQTAEPRWYELRGINSSTGTGTPTVQQQSTFNPDTNATFRFMGSIAADHNNNMLLGYTGSSSTIFPSLYVTGRLAGDTASTMETEQKVFAGLNSQVNVTISGNAYAYGYRWGDYSSVVIDPDDCTFWYTNEYMAQAGLFNWSTRIFNWNFGSSACTSLASITAPIPNAQGGAALTSASATFLWTPGTGTPTYTLAVGSTQGASDYCGGPQSYGAGVYTAALSCLPTDGSTFWVRLTTIPGGFQDYQYTAPSLSQSTTTAVSSSLNPSTYGQAANFTATVTAGGNAVTSGTVQFVVDGTNFGSAVTLNGSGQATSASTSTLTAGTHTVVANYSGSGSYLASNGTLSGGQVVNQVNASVTPSAASKTYGTADPSLTGTLSGFLPADNVTATYSRTAGETVAGGPYSISATLSPTGVLSNYNITYNTANFTISPAVASVTPNAASKTYGQADPSLTGTLSGFVAGDNVTATYTRAAGETVLGGPYSINATLSPTTVLSNYNITYNTANFTINAAVASVTPNAASKTYGQADPTLTGTLSGFVAGDNVTAIYTRAAGETVAGGPYSISATLSPTTVLGNYNITYNTAAFTISPAVASVTPNAASKTYGQADPTLTGTLSGFLPADGITGSYTRTAGETVAGSPYSISATLSPSGVLGNYNITYNTASFTIHAAVLTVTATNASMTYGGTVPTFTASYNGFVNGDTQAVLSGSPSLTTTATSNSPAGPYAITAAQGTLAAANYTFAFVNGTLNIGQATLLVTANNATMPEGGSVPSFSASYSGFLNGDGTGVLSGSPSLTTSATSSSPVGNYPIIAAQGTLAAQNYTFAFVNGNLTVTAVTAQITSPAKGSTLTSSAASFTWSHETGGTSYQIWVGSAPGTHNLGSVNTSALGATISALPTDGSTIYATLYGYANNVWTVQDTAIYTAATIVKAQITAPAKGSTLSGSSATLTWTAETGATAYQVWVGHSAGAHDIALVSTSALSAALTGLPIDGSQVYVTLYGYAATWTSQDTATYTAFNNLKATITNPTKGATFTGSKVTFSWTAESGATSYQLWVGNTPGAHDVAVLSTASLSGTISGLPIDGRPLYVTLYGYAGTWTVQDTASYTAAGVTKAVITTPAKGSTLPGSAVTFGWTAESGATSYQIWIGSTPGGSDLAVRTASGLSAAITGLPTNGNPVYVTLYGYTDAWIQQDVASYTAATQ